MTDFDKKLIEKANTFTRWNYRDIDILMNIADTAEAKQQLFIIKCDLYDMIRETI